MEYYAESSNIKYVTAPCQNIPRPRRTEAAFTMS